MAKTKELGTVGKLLVGELKTLFEENLSDGLDQYDAFLELIEDIQDAPPDMRKRVIARIRKAAARATAQNKRAASGREIAIHMRADDFDTAQRITEDNNAERNEVGKRPAAVAGTKGGAG